METWKDIPGYEGLYEVSSEGLVRSVDRVLTTIAGVEKVVRGRVLKPFLHKYGYEVVSLGRGSKRLIHQLVAAAFIGPNPSGLLVCHNDGNPRHNTPANLRYDTYSGNAADKRLHGTGTVGEAHPAAKLNEEQVRQIKALLAAKTHTHEQIAELFPVQRQQITKIARGQQWLHVDVATGLSQCGKKPKGIRDGWVQVIDGKQCGKCLQYYLAIAIL